MKKHEYIAKVNTGDVLGADTKRVLYATLKHYFQATPDGYMAIIMRDNEPIEIAWNTPKGIVRAGCEVQ